MATVTVHLDGADQLAGKLRFWEREKRRGIADLVARYLEIIAREARGLAPVDTGALRESIETDAARVLTELAGLVVAGADYAAFVEHGTSRMAAQPFLFPAFEMHARAFYDDLRQLLSS